MEHVDFFPPAPIDYFDDNPDKRWPAWKLGMEMEDLFNTLPQQFNCFKMPILDEDAFRPNVVDIVNQAKDRPEFDRLLGERMETRRKELLDMWYRALTHISGKPSLLADYEDQWPHAMHIYHFGSFDTYVRCFLGFLGPGFDFDYSRRASSPSNRGHKLPAPPATSTSPAPSAAVEAASLERESPSVAPERASPPRQVTPQPRQTQDSQGRVPSRRRRNQATIRSSDGIQKAKLGDSKGLRRSSRLKQNTHLSGEDGVRTRSSSRVQEETQSKKHSDHSQPTPAAGGTSKRKRGQEEDHDQQPQSIDSRGHPSSKKRKMDSGTADSLEPQPSHIQEGPGCEETKDDAEPPQHGQRGEFEVQGAVEEVGEDISKTIAGRRRRRSTRTKIGTGAGTRKGTKSDNHRVMKR